MLAYAQQPMVHSNITQQQVFLSIGQPSVNVTELPESIMINPTVSSTPISASTKRGRNDTSGISESNVQVRHQYPQNNHFANSSSTPMKRLR
ncbi:unnamed protein product, partial [Rotaria sp. Silwood1]